MAERDPIIEQLAAVRKASGMKQSTLARTVGLSQATVSQILLGRRSPSLRQLRLLCAALGCELMLS